MIDYPSTNMMHIEKEAAEREWRASNRGKDGSRVGWRFFAISAGDYFLYGSRYRHERTEAKKHFLPHFLGSAWHFVRKKIMARALK